MYTAHPLYLIILSLVTADHYGDDDPLAWLRNSIPGEPGQDYPVYGDTSLSSFSCSGRVGGAYYADTELSCQAYHLCLARPGLPDYLRRVSFLCPNGTVFNQASTVCDWWFHVSCPLAESQYATAGGEEETCPAVEARSGGDCETDQDSQANCWSPGQRDTDCVQSGLCCFDGCANRCVHGANPMSIKKQMMISTTTTTTTSTTIRTTTTTTTATTTTTESPTTTMIPDILPEGAGGALPQAGGVLLPEGSGGSLAQPAGVPLPEDTTDEVLPQYGVIVPIRESYLPLPDDLPRYGNNEAEAEEEEDVVEFSINLPDNEKEKVVEYDISLPDIDEDVFEYDVALSDTDNQEFILIRSV